MYNAPSVAFPVGRSFLVLAFLGLVWVTGAGVTMGLLTGVDLPMDRQATVLVLWLGCGAAAGRAWWRTPAGELRWDGKDWTWTGGIIRIERVALDTQSALLLRWHDTGGRRGWLLLERRLGPPRWGDLRRAVYSRRQAQTAPPSPGDAAPT